MADEICEIVYSKREVYIHEKPKDTDETLKDASKIGGQLQIFQNKHGHFIRFASYYDTANLEEWTYIHPNSVVSYTKDDTDTLTIENKATNITHRLKFNINDLKSIRRTYPGFGIASLTFILNDGSTWPPLHFHKGGSKEFLIELKRFFMFKRDPNDPKLFLVSKPDASAFQKSLHELNLFQENRNDVVKKFLNEPLNTTLLSFSKVTGILRDVLHSSTSNADMATSQTGVAVGGSTFYTKPDPASRQISEDGLCSLLDSVTDNIHMTNNDGFEFVTRVDLGPMPTVKRGSAVDKNSINLDKDGRILDKDKLKEQIFRGGIQPTLRMELWKYLLNCYDWDSTLKTRVELRKQKVDDYYRMKLQWKSFSEDQKMRSTLMRERESLIDKDVLRTDRSHVYFQGDGNPNLHAMRDILMTYNMYNFDLGYVQGMSDLLAPLMVIFDNEVDSFWAFVGFMNKMEPNFLMDQLHIKLQLENLQILLEFIDSKFAHYLEKNDSSNMYFCFRWIIILFKREFTFPDVMKLWEIVWSEYPCKNFHLLICIAILLQKKNEIMANNFGFNEILKFVNDMSLQIDLDRTLETAEGLFIQLNAYKNVPGPIAEILGLKSTNTDTENDLLTDGPFLASNSSASNLTTTTSVNNNNSSTGKEDDGIEVLS